MLRTVISIDEARCDGCGLCVSGCHEGALQIIDGKAKMVREDYCDGLGACIGECPRGAIIQEQREVAAFSLPPEHPMFGKVKTFEQVQAEQAADGASPTQPKAATADTGAMGSPASRLLESRPHSHGNCPGSRPRTLERNSRTPDPEAPLACGCPGSLAQTIERPARAPDAGSGCGCASGGCGSHAATDPAQAPSDLGQWPVQLRLVSPSAPYLKNADLLVCADCVPLAIADFHTRYLRDHAIVLGCPKLDDKGEMADKLAMILQHGGVRSLTVLRMEVPCCGGIAQAALVARETVNPDLPLEIHTIGIGGTIRVQAA